MKRLTLLAAAACLIALTSCSESEQTDDMAADAKHWQPVGRANPVSTDATTESEVVELPPPLSPKARAFVESVENDRPSKSESATGIEVDWGGVKMTSPEPRILPASMKDKIRERMSPREIVTTFGKGWMSKHSSVGSISWRFEDGSMIHMTYRPGTTLVDQAVDVHRHEPQRKEGETIKTDDEIKNTK